MGVICIDIIPNSRYFVDENVTRNIPPSYNFKKHTQTNGEVGS